MAARGHHELFYVRADALMWSEGEKRCINKMIGGKIGKFGQQDKVRTVGMTTVPKLKRPAS
jgi:hypothetical protein